MRRTHAQSPAAYFPTPSNPTQLHTATALPLPSALPCPALPCPALPCPALPCPALPCPALPCPALPCPALPCPALPHRRFSSLIRSGFLTNFRCFHRFHETRVHRPWSPEFPVDPLQKNRSSSCGDSSASGGAEMGKSCSSDGPCQQTHSADRIERTNRTHPCTDAPCQNSAPKSESASR